MIFDIIITVVAIMFFVLAFSLAKSAWMFWHEEKYKSKIPWVLLEIRIPRETTRGPKAMEQVFASVYNLANSPVGPKETYLDGEITRWFSIEIVGDNQQTRLYLRIPRPIIHPFTSSFYAQYPEIEILEVEKDYIDNAPADTYQGLKKKGYQMYGVEVTQGEPPEYVINTYVDFEPKIGDEKGRILDSMASILEIIGKMKAEETAWIQFLLIPDTKGHWLDGANKTIEKLKTTTQESGPSKGGEQTFRFRFRTQGEEKTLKRIEEKKGKACYETIIRMIYFAPKNSYNYDLLNRGIFGYVAQFGNDDQKFAKPDNLRTKVDWDSPPFIFPKRRLFWKCVSIYDEYRRRFIPEETFVGKLANSHPPFQWCFFHKPMILSAEELATLFHIPTNIVLTQVTMDRIESKRISAPSNIPS